MASSDFHTFGKYQIMSRIASGSTAEIYKAKLEGIGGFQRVFAIKRILPHLSANREYIDMLVEEAKVAGLLSHANIVQILDLGEVDGAWFIAMEYVDGPNLGLVLDRCAQKGLQLPVPHVVFIGIELLKGLSYAHQRQVMRGGRAAPLSIIHRSISPSNILMSKQGEVKLTDFGLAKANFKAQQTAAGVIKGQFDYLSPEQAGGAKDIDQRSDIFGVGIVLYEMLTGVHPFRAESERKTIERIRAGQYPPISSVNPSVPFTLETIVDRAMRVNRDERFPSAGALKEALEKFFHDAGFMFNHHSLAEYLRSLGLDQATTHAPSVPTRLKKAQLAQLPGMETGDLGPESPTRVASTTDQSVSRSGVFGMVHEDTQTLTGTPEHLKVADESKTASRGDFLDPTSSTSVGKPDISTVKRPRPGADAARVDEVTHRSIQLDSGVSEGAGAPVWLLIAVALVVFCVFFFGALCVLGGWYLYSS